MRFYVQTCFLLGILALLYSSHQSLAQEQESNSNGASHDGPSKGLSPHAKQVLLAAARERVAELGSTELQQQESDWPSFDSLVNPKTNEILTDVQFLLDFAVVGFGKCGTTTLLQWLQTKANNNDSGSTVSVRAPNYEAQFLVNQKPEMLVRKMHQFGIEEQELKQTTPDARILKGFKNPSDIRRQKSRDLLTKYWPDTPVIVTVRHPVHWLVSIYNYFKIEKGRHQAQLTSADILDRGGRDVDGNTQHYVSTAKGEFHAMLAELGKTPLATTNEWRLLQPWLNPDQTERIRQHKLPNPIFFMEMGQLADSANATRSQQFAHDLEAFLGLPRGHLPLAPHVRPKANLVKNLDTSQLKMDICDPQYQPVLEEMVAIGRAAAQWFQDYFIPSPDVTVSNPQHLRELLEQWKVDPCGHGGNRNPKQQQ